MVMAKPIQFTIVSDEPFDAGGAFCAIRVENMGESAITAILQVKRNRSSTTGEGFNKNKGETRQQAQDTDKAVKAVFFAPQC